MRRNLLGCGAAAMLLSSFDLIERRAHGGIPAGEVDNDRRRVIERIGAVPDAWAGDVESLRAGLSGGMPVSRQVHDGSRGRVPKRVVVTRVTQSQPTHHAPQAKTIPFH